MDQSGERECVSVKLEDFIFFFFWLVERKTKRTKMAEGEREEKTKKQRKCFWKTYF